VRRSNPNHHPSQPPENVPYWKQPFVSGLPNLFAGLDLNQLPKPVKCGGRGFLGLQFASLISIQVFQVFVRFQTTIEKGVTLNGKRLIMNIANHMCLRFQNNLSSPNGTFDFSVHNDALGCNGSVDVSAAGNDQKSAVEFAINLAIDLD
jgi:hypothetical protein